MVFNATFNTISIISWQSSFIGGGNGVPGEDHRPVAESLTNYYVGNESIFCKVKKTSPVIPYIL
jgi:hypothetical protein